MHPACPVAAGELNPKPSRNFLASCRLRALRGPQVGYAERLNNCVFFNAPNAFFYIWKAVRVFLDVRLASKARAARRRCGTASHTLAPHPHALGARFRTPVNSFSTARARGRDRCTLRSTPNQCARSSTLPCCRPRRLAAARRHTRRMRLGSG